MKMFIFVLLASLFNTIAPFTVVPIDSANLLGMFSRSNTYNQIKLNDQSLPPVPTDQQNEFKVNFKFFFEEQCAIKCLKSISCMRYSFSASGECRLFMRANFNRQINFASTEQANAIKSLIGCDLQSCTKGAYCATSNKCLCPSSMNGPGCTKTEDYIFSSMSGWSSCTANCNQTTGFSQRSQTCMKKYFNSDSSQPIVNNSYNMDWLCANSIGALANQVQINTCSIEQCRLYADWSSWTPCSKICDGSTSRVRTCFPNVNCDSTFLKQTKLCGLDQCYNTLTGNIAVAKQLNKMLKRLRF